MARLTKLRVKDDTGNFPNTYPIGAEAENVIFNSGDNLEEKIDAIENEIKADEENTDTKAPIYHASETTEYGLGDEEKYGHLRITDEYEEINDDPSHTALSSTGIVDLFNRYLQIFEVLDNVNDNGQMLYSAYNTAYKEFKDNMVVVNDGNHLIVEDDNTLYLISKYFDIEESNDGAGHQTLIINIKDSYI